MRWLFGAYVLLAFASPACATPTVPEIDGTGAGIVLGLLAAAVMVLALRHR